MTSKTVSAFLITGSFLATNFFNINLLSQQPKIQIGEVAQGQASNVPKLLRWGAKAIGTGALSAFGAWGFNTYAKANLPQPAQRPQKTYVGSFFSSQRGFIYSWSPSSGWSYYDGNSRRFVAIQAPGELLYRNYDVFQLSNGGYKQEVPPGRFGYHPTQGWIQFQ